MINHFYSAKKKFTKCNRIKTAVMLLVAMFGHPGSAVAKDLPGSSETSWNVSPSGAFNFQMQVMTPAGRNGVKPNVSINYSSSQGNGSLGVGWNVSAGLMAITRCAQTHASNWKSRGVQHGRDDRFCLNGQQLKMVVGSTYGADGTEYRAEVEQFSNVLAIGSRSKNLVDSGTAPNSWKMWAKDGRIYTFGGTADSRLDVANGSAVSTHRWNLSKVEDRSGNAYTVEYRSQEGLPSRINYTSNSYGLAAQQRVDYVYEARPDQRSRYVFGRKIDQTVRLSSLKVINNSQTYREYKFSYETRTPSDLRPSRLTHIEECGLNASCLPKVPVAWKAETDGFSNTASTGAGDTLPTYLTKYADLNGVDVELSYGTLVDINADGLTDVVIAVIEPNGNFKAQTYLKTHTGWQLSTAWRLPKSLRSYDLSLISIGQFTQTQLDQGRLIDVNGDGLVDLVYSYEHFTDTTQANVRYRVSEVYLNSETGFSTTASTTYTPPNIPNTSTKQVLADYTSNGGSDSVMRTERARLIDLNGDGLVDWVTAYFDYTSAGNGITHTATHLNTGSGWEAAPNAAYEMDDYFVQYFHVLPPLPHGEFIDINADGLVDWVQAYQFIGRDAAPVRTTWLNTGAGWDKRTNTSDPVVAPEAIYQKNTGERMAYKRGSFIDLNGDGLRDWVVSYQEYSTVKTAKTYLNTGRGWVLNNGYKTDFHHLDYQYSDPGRNWPVNNRGTYVDLNRDGLVDYVEAYRPVHQGVSQPEVKNAWLNTGSGWVQRNDLHPGWILNDYDQRGNDRHKIAVSSVFDVNSDGSPDWVKVREGELATLLNLQSRPNQLDSITTNTGVKVKPTYGSLSGMPGLYTRRPVNADNSGLLQRDPDAMFFGTTMYVTSKLEVARPDNPNAFNATTYQYGGAQINRIGRGFLGFYHFTSTNEKGITQTQYFHQTWPLTGMAFKTQVAHNDDLLSSVDNDYSAATYNNNHIAKKRLSPRLNSRTTKAYELGGLGQVGETVRSLSYDVHGNVVTDVTSIKTPTGVTLSTVTKTSQFHGYGSSQTDWPISLASQTTVTSAKSGQPTVVNRVDFDYTHNGLLERASREPNAADPSVRLLTEYQYNAYGNVTQETVSRFANDPQARQTHYQYDANNRLPVHTTNAKGHVSQVSYHAVCDAPQIVTDPNLLQAHTTHTDFCLEHTTTTPDLVVKTTTYQWGNAVQACPTSAQCQSAPAFAMTVSTTGQPTVTSLANRHGQPLLSITQGMDLTAIHQTTEYDRHGRTLTQSQPHFAHEAKSEQTFFYDVLDRPTRINLPFDSYPDASGASAPAYQTVRYRVSSLGNAYTTERDGEGKLKHTHTNALGQVVQIVDADGEDMHYRYNAKGDLAETEDAQGNIISVQYDALGRRTALIDPDLGTTLYTHSPFGEITAQEDAEGLMIVTEYDQLGRMIERRVPSNGSNGAQAPSLWDWDISTWTYDQGGNKRGLLIQTQTRQRAGTPQESLAYRKQFAYDNVNRLVTEVSLIKGQSFTQRYGYNAEGQLNFREYPSGGGTTPMQISLNYDNGYLSSITDKPLNSAQCIEHWRANEYDALGRLRSERLGRIINTQRVIDPHQGVVRGMQASLLVNGQQQVQNLVYDYDASNNLKLRNDQLTNTTEEFGYDNLQRLVEHQRNGAIETTVQYDAIGNITYKSDVGSYQYTGAQPHALSRVTLPISHSANTQQFAVNWQWDGQTLQKGLPSIHNQTFTYDQKGSVTRSGNRAVYWTAFSKPNLMISEQVGGTQFGSTIEYDADFNRMFKEKATYTGFATLQQVKESTYYVGKDYERIDTSSGTTHRYHIKAGSHAIQIERNVGQIKDKTHYLLADNLGSTNVIIDQDGDVVQRLAFDPWGMRTQTDPLISGETIPNNSVNDITTRGYTGHEMDDEVGLINMNARIYDPYLGRFLSADPVLPDATDMQQFNRYAYVTNNPLKFTDPTGHSGVCFTCTGTSYSAMQFFDLLTGGGGGFRIGVGARLGARWGFDVSFDIDVGDIAAILRSNDSVDNPDSNRYECDSNVTSHCGESAPINASAQGEGPTITFPNITVSISFGDDESDNYKLDLTVSRADDDGRCSTKICFTGSQSKNDTVLAKWQGILARYAATREGATRLFDYFTTNRNSPFVINLRTTADTLNEGDGRRGLNGARSSFAGRGFIAINVNAQNSSSPVSLVYPGANGTFVGSELRVFAHESFHALTSGDRRLNEDFAILSANSAVLQDATLRGVPQLAGVRVGHQVGVTRGSIADKSRIRE